MEIEQELLQNIRRQLLYALQAEDPRVGLQAALRIVENPPRDPDTCPRCGSREIVAHKEQAESRIVYRDVECESCEAEWVETFIFSHAEIQ